MEQKKHVEAYLKGQSPLKSEIHILPLTCSAANPSGLFRCELLSFGAIICKHVCLCSNVMELDGTQLCLFPAIVTWFLKIIHIPSCEQFLLHLPMVESLVNKANFVLMDLLCSEKTKEEKELS